MTEHRPRVLLIDDEQDVLNAIRRQISRRFELATATGGHEALELVRASAPFTVVVSDIRMPRLDGIATLRLIHAHAPETVRILLTGDADLEVAIAAVNECRVFRFLLKPCPPSMLLDALQEAISHHDVLQAERAVARNTVDAAVLALARTIELVNPTAYASAMAVRLTALRAGSALGLPNLWPLDVAAVLSKLGAIRLPPAVAEKMHLGLPLDPDEQDDVDRVPQIALAILQGMPQLDEVLPIIRLQGSGIDVDDAPIATRILRAADHYEALLARGRSPLEAVRALRAAPLHDPDVVDAIATGHTCHGEEREVARE